MGDDRYSIIFSLSIYYFLLNFLENSKFLFILIFKVICENAIVLNLIKRLLKGKQSEIHKVWGESHKNLACPNLCIHILDFVYICVYIEQSYFSSGSDLSTDFSI